VWWAARVGGSVGEGARWQWVVPTGIFFAQAGKTGRNIQTFSQPAPCHQPHPHPTHLLQEEYALRQAAIRAEPLEIIYSYYNGTGHRRAVTVRKGDNIGQFLKAVVDQLTPQFREIRWAAGAGWLAAAPHERMAMLRGLAPPRCSPPTQITAPASSPPPAPFLHARRPSAMPPCLLASLSTLPCNLPHTFPPGAGPRACRT
jgi:hypothetical protein